MGSTWIEVNHWITDLYPFLRREAYKHIGGSTGQDVYVVWHGDDCMYVGKTLNGVWARLHRHAKTSSSLGFWLIDHEFDDSLSIQLEIIGVGGDIDMAEQHTISACGPRLNTIRYKSALTLPPIAYVEPTLLDITDVAPWMHSVFKVPVTGNVATSRAYSAGYDLYKLDSAYERAYRDPNHPDVRGSADHAVAWLTGKDVFYHQRTKRLRTDG